MDHTTKSRQELIEEIESLSKRLEELEGLYTGRQGEDRNILFTDLVTSRFLNYNMTEKRIPNAIPDKDQNARRRTEQELHDIEWLLGKSSNPKTSHESRQPYGELTALNLQGEIRGLVGRETLEDIVSECIDLLETNVSVLERNGEYALSIFSSEWCRYLDSISRTYCGTESNIEAISCGKWLCHESCRKEAAERALTTGKPAEIRCSGGLNIYAVPVMAGNQIIGTIQFAYGAPPSDPEALDSIAKLYATSTETLAQLAKNYRPRPRFIIDVAQKHLLSSARLIGTIAEGKKAEIALQKACEDIEKRVESRTEALRKSYELLKEEARERRKAEEELSQRQEALESVYAMATAFSSSQETIFDQAVLSINSILSTASTAIAFVNNHAMPASMTHVRICQLENGRLSQKNFEAVDTHPCGIALQEKKACQFSGDLSFMFPRHMEGRNGFRSIIGVPILSSSGETLGSIVSLDKVDRFFTEYETHTVEIFARYISHELERTFMEIQLLQAREMKILGQLTSGVAHEVRNPLNAIMAITEALGRDLKNHSEYHIYLEHIGKQVTRLSDLMRDLLELGRPVNSKDMMPAGVMPLVSAAVNSWKQSSMHSGRIVRIISSEDAKAWRIQADRHKIEQVFMNLLENACHHSPGDSEITIEITGTDSSVSIKVIDRGTGIKPEHMNRLFHPFFTTRKGGTGLGLGIVKHIIEDHGGTIVITNNSPPPGAMIELNIPLYRVP